MPNDLGPDVAQRVAINSRQLVPAGPAPTGHRLTVTGQEPFEFAWRQPEEKQVREGNGDPNGVVTAPKSTLYVERDAPSLWQNTDGLTAWTEIGSGSGGGFPITEDDGTNTALIDFASGDLFLSNTLDAGSVLRALIKLWDDGFIDVESHGGLELHDHGDVSGSGVFIEAEGATSFNNDAGVFIEDDGGGIYLASFGAFGGSIQAAAGSNSYFQATETTGVSEAFMAVQNLSAGVDGENWSKPTFHTQANDAQNIWDGMVNATVSADLNASQFGFWLDDTPGSVSINWVAKDSAGTVATGSVALT